MVDSFIRWVWLLNFERDKYDKRMKEKYDLKIIEELK